MRSVIFRRSIEAVCIAAMLGASSCSEREEEASALSDKEITFRLPEWTPMQSRAVLFEDKDDLQDAGKGGGNFTLYAHVDGTDYTYIKSARVWYFNDPQVKRWIFLDSKNVQITYYWPNSDALNFFAFMPDKNYIDNERYKEFRPKPTFVEIGPYSEEKGQTFSCDLPASAGDATEIQEFIYAYEEAKTKKDNPVTLKFKHPFAVVNFKVAAGSYRMTINDISFNDIYLKGTFSTATGAWEPSGSAGKYTAEINKRIPNEVNYNTPLGKPFLVMPQSLNGVRLTLNASRTPDKEGSAATPITASVPLPAGGTWEPGKKYTYIINYGDKNEEIYFNVEVEDWIAIQEGNNIDVE